VERLATGATVMQGWDGLGVKRYKMIRRSILAAGGLLGLVAIVPLIGGMINNPYKDNALYYTPWRKGMRLTRLNGTPIRPGDMEPGSLETVFPPIPDGIHQADAPTMLIRLQARQAAVFKARKGQESFRWNDFVAYSKICTHLGCPVSLYEQQTGRILCPCHQSQFDVAHDAAPVFGPASRSLPQLPIALDAEGYFIALSDYREAVGPGFWDRERRP
jgi:ubiquinol-cytochrome c reductase iron-sulfur subunit